MPRRPLDILNVVVVSAVLLMAIGCDLAGRLASAPWLPVRCALMLVGVFVVARLARLGDRLPAPGRLAVEFYPLALIPLVYDSLGFLIPAINPGVKDGWLIAADRAIFGVDPMVWLQRFIVPALTDLLYLAYATFFFFPLVVGLPMWRRAPEKCRRFIFIVSFAFYLSYAGYMMVPAEGPRVALRAEATVPLQTDAISRAIPAALNWLERNQVDAFPSGHVMITVVCLIAAAGYSRKLFWGLAPVAALLVCSTIYCRYHYVVDVAAGLALAPTAWFVGGWMYDS